MNKGVLPYSAALRIPVKKMKCPLTLWLIRTAPDHFETVAAD
jgi:hypothetical protein